MSDVQTARFKPGDHVRLVANPQKVWAVMDEDTNRTPVRDPEPAYRLSGIRHGRWYRYAYESDLMPA